MPRVHAVALLAVSLATAGCALIVGKVEGTLEPDASNGAGGAGGAGHDAGATPKDAGRDGHHAGKGDDAAAGDSGHRGGPPDASRSPCATHHTLCDDFDSDDAGVASRWTGVTGPSAAGPTPPILEITSAESVSPPDSLHISVGATSDSVAYLTQVFAPPVATLHCELDARLASAPGATRLVGLSIGYDSLSFTLGASSELASCYYPPPDAAAGCGSQTGVPTPSPGAWKHLTLVLDVTDATLTLDYDGAQVGAIGLVAAPKDDTGSVTLALGFEVPYNALGPLDVYVDNFWCDVTP